MTEIEKINLKKKYPGVANSSKYLITLYGSFRYDAGGITGDAADLMSRLSTKINWPQCCLLCLKPVTLLDFYKISGTTDGFWRDLFATDDYVVYAVEVAVPYCLECRRKVKKIFFREKEGVNVIPPEGSAMKFIFRNPEYAKLFKQINIKIARK